MFRLLVQGGNPCLSNCQYCFAKWSEVCHPFSKTEIDYITNKTAIIYPCCDSDFFLQDNLYDTIFALSKIFEKIYISISTKNNVNKSQLDGLITIDRKLKRENKGFIKLSVSFSTKSLLSEIEPQTLNYSQRIQLLQTLIENNIFTSVILKPMLPFIPMDEYYKLVDDTEFAKNYTLGGLYVNINTYFYNHYIHNQYDISDRAVEWLPNNTTWKYVDQSHKESKLKQYIIDKGLNSYVSDKDFILSLIN